MKRNAPEETYRILCVPSRVGSVKWRLHKEVLARPLLGKNLHETTGKWGPEMTQRDK